MDGKKKLIVILTFEKNPIAADLFVNIYNKYNAKIIYTRRCGFLGLDSLFKYFRRRRGIRWLLFDLLSLFAKAHYKIDHLPAKGWHELQSEYDDDFIAVEDHNSQINKSILDKLKPELGVLIGTPLIKPCIFNMPKYGMVNLHQDDLEIIRGAPAAFWEYQMGLSKMCITVHSVVERFDAGNIINRKCFSINEDNHFILSKIRGNLLSADLISTSIDDVLSRKGGRTPSKLGELKTVPSYILLFREFLRLFKYKLLTV